MFGDCRPENITKEIKQIRKRMKNRVSARQHSQKQSQQMKQLCQELHIKNQGLEAVSTPHIADNTALVSKLI